MKEAKNIRIENVILPNKPLSNFEHLEAVKKLGLKNFRGVFLRDTLPKQREEASVVLRILTAVQVVVALGFLF